MAETRLVSSSAISLSGVSSLASNGSSAVNQRAGALRINWMYAFSGGGGSSCRCRHAGRGAGTPNGSSRQYGRPPPDEIDGPRTHEREELHFVADQSVAAVVDRPRVAPVLPGEARALTLTSCRASARLPFNRQHARRRQVTLLGNQARASPSRSARSRGGPE